MFSLAQLIEQFQTDLNQGLFMKWMEVFTLKLRLMIGAINNMGMIEIIFFH